MTAIEKKLAHWSYRLSMKYFFYYAWNERRLGFKPKRLRGPQPVFRKHNGQEINVQAVLDELFENGVVLIDEYFDPNYVTKLSKQCDEMSADCVKNPPLEVGIFDNKFGYAANLLKEGILRVFKIEEKIPEIRSFEEDPFFHYIGKAYYGRPLRRETTIFQRNEMGKEETRGWHVDSWVNQFKSFLYLSDVEIDNGPFMYALGSHKNTNFLLKKLYDCYRGKSSTDIQESDIQRMGFPVKKFSSRKGALILADTKGIHRGGPVTSGTRDAVVNYFYV